MKGVCRFWLLVGFVLYAWASPAWAQQGSIVMRADRSEVALGELFQLTIKAEVQGGRAGDIQLPDLSAFDVVGRSVSRPVQFQFGFGSQGGRRMMSSSTVYQLRLRAVRAGKIQLSPASIEVGGRVLRSNTLSVQVRPGAGANSAGSAPNTNAAPADPSLSAQADAVAFLRTVVDRQEAYVGEQITVNVYLYTRRQLTRSPSILREVSTDGFWTHNLLDTNEVRSFQQEVGGRIYLVYPLRKFAAFALKPGTLRLGAMRLSMSTGSLFDIFRGGGDGEITRESTALSIKAKALPNRDGQSVAVGDYRLSSRVDNNEAKTGDAITYEAIIEGTGNLRNIEIDLPTIEGLRILRPQIKDDVQVSQERVGGTRRIQWLVVPQKPGQYTLPALTLKVFDPAQGKYQTLNSETHALTITGDALADTQDPSAVTARQDAAQETPVFVPKLPSLRSQSALLRHVRPWTQQTWLWWLLALGPTLLLLSASLYAWRQRRQRVDQHSSRHVIKKHERDLRDLEGQLGELPADVFYMRVPTLLHEALEAKLKAPTKGMSYSQLDHFLAQRALAHALRQRVIAELESCDFARFSMAGAAVEEMRDCLGRTRSLIQDINALNDKKVASYEA